MKREEEAEEKGKNEEMRGRRNGRISAKKKRMRSRRSG